MRIFLTGATGFIGQRLLARLENHDVLALSRHQQSIHYPGVHFIAGDLNNTTWTNEVKDFSPHICLHLAWEGLPDYSLERCQANLNTSLILFKKLAELGIKRFITTGSCWEYGNASGPVCEVSSIGDLNIFAATKQALRLMLTSLALDYGIDMIWTRLFFTYGPNQRASSLIPQCHAAYSQGRLPQIQKPDVAQDFIYVDDAAEALVRLVETEKLKSGLFNIGSGQPTTVGMVVNEVAKYFGKPLPYSSTKPTSGFWADTKKIKEATSWEARTSLQSGVQQTLKVLDQKNHEAS